jgi:hypothetical protein
MLPFEIYTARIEWNGCTDLRPVLIVQIRPGDVFGCFPFASNCYSGSCFAVSADDGDFAATGLAKSCFIHDSHLYDLPRSAFVRHRGALVGKLLAEFREFSGV